MFVTGRFGMSVLKTSIWPPAASKIQSAVLIDYVGRMRGYMLKTEDVYT
jgi:hypothetical protein